MKTLVIKIMKIDATADVIIEDTGSWTNKEIIQVLTRIKDVYVDEMNDGSFRDIKEVVENARS